MQFSYNIKVRKDEIIRYVNFKNKYYIDHACAILFYTVQFSFSDNIDVLNFNSYTHFDNVLVFVKLNFLNPGITERSVRAGLPSTTIKINME